MALFLKQKIRIYWLQPSSYPQFCAQTKFFKHFASFQHYLFITCNIFLMFGNTITVRYIGKLLTNIYFQVFIDIEIEFY